MQGLAALVVRMEDTALTLVGWTAYRKQNSTVSSGIFSGFACSSSINVVPAASAMLSGRSQLVVLVAAEIMTLWPFLRTVPTTFFRMIPLKDMLQVDASRMREKLTEGL